MKVGEIVWGKVNKIFKSHIIVNFPNGWSGLLHISNLSDYFVFNISNVFKEGQKYCFLISEIEMNKKQVKLNWKKIMPRFNKNPFKFEIEETASGFKNLKEMTRKEVEND